MAGENKFGQKPGDTGGRLRCEEWEALLTDALDGLLPAADAAAFKAHSTSCENCGDLLAHAEQGREWLGYLHTEPDVPAGLLGRILDRTVGAGSMPLPVVAAGQGAGAMAMAMPLRRSFHETRLMMTVAMAFFSIALTLNLAGVKLTDLKLADLRPSVIGSTLSRGFFSAQEQVVRYYDNLRFMYQLESRMRELRRAVETPEPVQQPETQKKSGPSQQKGGDGRLRVAPERGEVLNASENSGQSSEASEGRATVCVQRSAVSQPEGQLRQDGSKVRVLLVKAVHRISLDRYRAGQHTGYDRRSLA